MFVPYLPIPPAEMLDRDLESVASGKDDNVRLGINRRGQPYSEPVEDRPGRRF
jgi:hypothetical protein